MKLKRIFDFCFALVGLLALSPILAVVMLAIWLQDLHSPFYIASRVARGGESFKMVKLRSMVFRADQIGGASTANTDRRITFVGKFVRSYKLDEFMQLWNVLKGDMSLVGPRPQVPVDVALYTEAEKRLLTIRPGITDPASIVFSDEGEILKGSSDPDLLYQQIIRPWKSRLALAYIEHRNFWCDLQIIVLTLTSIVSRELALRGLGNLLNKWNLDPILLRMATRNESLLSYPPPGGQDIVTHYP